MNGPHGTFFTQDSDVPIIFLAGGTGLAPVKAMVEQLLDNESHRSIYIYWGISSIDFLYTELPNKWHYNYDNITYAPVLSVSDNEWKGRYGLVHQAVMLDFDDLIGFDVYACGSSDMTEAAKSDFLKHGLKEQRFFADIFTPFKTN